MIVVVNRDVDDRSDRAVSRGVHVAVNCAVHNPWDGAVSCGVDDRWDGTASRGVNVAVDRGVDDQRGG